MGPTNFEALFGENLLEDAGPRETKRKPKLVSLRPNKPDSEPAKQGDTQHISVDQIVVSRQHRKSFEGISELAASIKSHGLIQPLIVRYRADQMFELVAGERRLRAVKELGSEMVPCLIMQLSEGEVSAIQLAENLNRDDLNAIEEAQGFADVIKKNNLTLEQVAKMFGRNKGTVSRSLQLLKLPSDIQAQVAEGELSARKAIELGRLGSDAEQRRALEQSKQQSLTAEQTRKLVTSRVGTTRRTRAKQNTKTFRSEHGELSVTVGSDATYHHVKAILVEVLEEVELRLNNRVTL